MNMLEQTENHNRDETERVRARLRQLMEMSRDPDYDRYLAQMMKDLENRRATPFQVEREAERSYRQYQERMKQLSEESRRAKDNVEFKIGMHVFSLIGAVLVLTSFVIFSINFLSGLGQGLCLYGAALMLVLLSELFIRRKVKGFSYITTGIGIGGLYIANITNYLILYTINEAAAMAVTLAIALGAIFLSRKRGFTAVRIISLAGCYICFLFIRGFETELNFLTSAIMLFIINIADMAFPDRKNSTAEHAVHLAAGMILTAVLTGCAWGEDIHAVYLAFFVVTSFIFVSFLSLKEGMKDGMLFALCCIGNGFCIFLLFLIGNAGPGIMRAPEAALFVHVASEALVLVVCSVVFLLWNKEDGRRWAQLYYWTATALFLGSFSEIQWEIIVTLLLVLCVVKIFASHREVMALDCIVVTWTGMVGIWLADNWKCRILAGALLLSIFGIRHMHLYHQMVVTVSILLIWYSQSVYYIQREVGWHRGWFYPVSAGILLTLFLLFNHLPHLKNKIQLPYNIANVVLMAVYCLGVWTCNSYIFSSAMMVIGAVAIIIMFRGRYKMAIQRKYLVLAGFLTYFTLTGHYESPVIVSILLMAIAFGCVGAGFKLNDKMERICGLVLAALVCLKLAIYDFSEVESLYRVIVCLIVGVAALMISLIYVQLEKKTTNYAEKG